MSPDFDTEILDTLQRQAFDYFRHETNPTNGLVADNSLLGAPASIASVGFALAPTVQLSILGNGVKISRIFRRVVVKHRWLEQSPWI